MARAYAGALGSLAMGVTLLRGALGGGGVEGTVTMAITAMLALSGVGWVVGRVAEATVDESVRHRLQRQIDRHEAPAA